MWHSIRLIFSGARVTHGDAVAVSSQPMPIWWRFAMGISCACYLLPAAVWSFHGWGRMGALFVLVSACSTMADAVRLDWNIVRSVDRAVGAMALTSSCVINSTTLANAGLCMASVVTSLWWLRAGREVRQAKPEAMVQYLVFHGVWHVWGAIAVCFVTHHVQSTHLIAKSSEPHDL